MRDRFAVAARRRGMFAMVLLAASTGCDFTTRLVGGYVGPQPAQESLEAEVATVASARVQYQGQLVFYLDRSRYVDAGKPHDVNRVVKAWTTPENQEAVAGLDLRPGERVRVTTQYVEVDEAAGSHNVPNWPGHGAVEYPIGSHRIIAIERVAP